MVLEHICVPRVSDLILLILHDAHSSRYSIHPSTTIMYSYHVLLCLLSQPNFIGRDVAYYNLPVGKQNL